ncbi:hypothetical protein K439DRAFT_1614160 [Ramaria rubella]|nr:hypothetical protein K439DRAFT_1614160 [Ramaria rubella]
MHETTLNILQRNLTHASSELTSPINYTYLGLRSHLDSTCRPFPLPTPPESISDADTNDDGYPRHLSILAFLSLAPISSPAHLKPAIFFPPVKSAGWHTATVSLIHRMTVPFHSATEERRHPHCHRLLACRVWKKRTDPTLLHSLAVSPDTATGAASSPQCPTSDEIVLYQWIKTCESNQPHGSLQLKPTQQACYSLDGHYAAIKALSKATLQYQL